MPHPILVRPTLPSPPQDRFLAFAFAAADLLVEAAADGTIMFADGAFNARFHRPAASFVGGALHQLVAAEDHPALALSLAALRQHGRASPCVVRLADAEGSRMTLSALAMKDGTHLYVTFGQPTIDAAPGPECRGCFTAVAEVHTAGQLHAGPGAAVAELSGRRFGVLAAREADRAVITGEIGHMLRGTNLGANTRADTRATYAGMDLEDRGISPARAARALRMALGGFRDGGLEAAARLGLGEGLIGYVAAADARIEATCEAIQERRFSLVFQPIVTLRDRQIHHYEALLRPISTTKLTVQGPQEFVLFAEAAGLSEELDWAVLDEACTACEAAPGVSVAVNISGLSMQSATFRNRMLDRLARAAKAGASVLIELTETADIEDFESAGVSMTGLRAAGIPVCLDDFGSGSAAFRYLREFRVDYVKLDGSYVRGALTSAREHGFLLSMVELANFMGAKTVAETIETEAQEQFMLEIGIEFGQGYLFGRPGPLPGTT
jgi:EAL domain-containing protein (putative c-di-GMP-specific phosphodiesterase class I)/PAS domain-containing protein